MSIIVNVTTFERKKITIQEIVDNENTVCTDMHIIGYAGMHSTHDKTT